MSVTYWACDRCGYTFNDSEDRYFSCESCDNRLCGDCMEVLEVWVDHSEDGIECPFCCNEVVTDAGLLDFAVGLLGMDREGLERRWREVNPIRPRVEDLDDEDDKEDDDEED